MVRVLPDVEIYSLRFRWGWDLSAFVLFAAVAAIIQKVRRRRVLVPITATTLLAAALSIAMVIYPALTLSGRMSSRFTGVDRWINESIAFAAVVALALVSAIVLLSRAQRENPAAHPPARRA
jgi:hypothetical protein